jgi:hypothetical protein
LPLEEFPRLETAILGLEERIEKQAETWAEALKNSRERLAEEGKQEEAWQHYAKVYNESQSFFSECVKIMGGLAFRAAPKGERDTIYRMADELAGHCAELAGPRWVAPTVPVQSETLVRAWAHIIGLRFPQWTIWDLPLTAHEQGHVVVEAEHLWKSSDPQAKGLSKEGARTQVATYRYELMADAFATYVMGPAYACAAVLLNLDPLKAHLDRRGSPTEAERAHVILSMLGRMSSKGNGVYDYRLNQLEEKWQSMLQQIGQLQTLDDRHVSRKHVRVDEKNLEQLVDEVERKFERLFKYHPSAEYPYEEGWGLAKQWAEHWGKALKAGVVELTIEDMEIPKESSLRDVLNGAWLCRLDYPDKVDEIAKVAEDLFKQVTAKIQERERRGKLARLH